MNKEEVKARISLRISKAEHQDIRRMAYREECSMQELVRRSLRREISRLNKKHPQKEV